MKNIVGPEAARGLAGSLSRLRRTLGEAYAELRPARVLVAEDDFELRTMLALSLQRRGYEVTEVTDGNGLLDELGASLLRYGASSRPDLVISDVRMPGKNGMDVLAGLRGASWTTPFIFMTAFGDAETHERAARLGAVVYDKPFDLDELCAAVASKLVQA
jgi:DNA-binding response OmpR family regulator